MSSLEELVVGAAAALAALVDEGEVHPSAFTPPYGLDVTQDTAGYRQWLEVTEPRWRDEHEQLLRRLGPGGPTISLLTPVYRPDMELLRRCIDSVRTQTYPHWELCLCDDASGDEAVVRFLEAQAITDPRIRVAASETNGGISAATNGAAHLATGAFLGLLDQDDELDHRALAHVAGAIADDPLVDLVYTDEDKLDEQGNRLHPYFKPDWSPDLLLSNMYIGHLTVMRRALFERVGGFRSAFDGSQDYDLALRTTELARRIAHVPYLAYRWRMSSGSTAADYGAKPSADLAARAALGDAMARRGEVADIESGLHEGTFRVRRALPKRAKVAVIVPFRDGATLLSMCVESLVRSAGSVDWEAILVDNQSWEPETLALLRTYEGMDRVRLLSFDRPFNWSAINNEAARETDADYLLFLNSDVEARHDGWIEAMVEHAARPEVGVVGARLLYPDDRIQHAGVVLGLGGGVAWHPFCFLPADQPGYFAQPRVVRNWSAVTGACFMVRRSVFEQLDGFEEELAVAFNDVDFCLRARAAGLSIVYTPFAELYHHESASRGQTALEATETMFMFKRWSETIRSDPFFNENLDPMRAEYNVALLSQEVRQWDWVRQQAEKWLQESGTS
jgi:GT2 family glycosyltransferase